MKKLPLGIQTFGQIRGDDYVYVDKTKEAWELTQQYKYAFLSRPRRFGKSLFLDTLKELFEGNEPLFEGLFIHDKWNWNETFPVIKISWSGQLQNITQLDENLVLALKANQNRLGISCDKKISSIGCFRELIRQAYETYHQPVVILVDEYDKPILDVIENTQKAKEHRDYLRGLYSVIKDSDAYVRFAFLTGVSKFSKASIFSGLNMLSDISLDPPYGNICGYTQHDVDTLFAPFLQGVDRQKLAQWYNGYFFLKDNVYNPFDILQFIAKGCLYRNYWFETGTPSFLIRLIESRRYFLPRLADLVVDEKLLGTFEIENIDVEVLLYQSGYLTIDAVIEKRRGGFEYRLKLPNKEVKSSLNDYIIDYMLHDDNKEKRQDDLYDALADGNLELLENTLNALFASIPYHNYVNNDLPRYEGFYASVLFAYFQSLGIDIVGEDVTNRGRIDLTLFVENNIYILEFKVHSGDPLEQIRHKRYFEKYLDRGKQLFLVGIVFDEHRRNISAFEYEKVPS